MSWLGLLDVPVSTGVVCSFEFVRGPLGVGRPIPPRRDVHGGPDLLLRCPRTGQYDLLHTSARSA